MNVLKGLITIVDITDEGVQTLGKSADYNRHYLSTNPSPSGFAYSVLGLGNNISVNNNRDIA
jgi:hypothetical protein